MRPSSVAACRSLLARAHRPLTHHSPAGVMSWGAAMLERYGKSHEGPRFDFTNTHLGYNT